MKKPLPPRLPTEAPPPLTHSPFAKLHGAPATPAAAVAVPKAAPAPSRAVVRFERKGRGGKEVTVIEQLDLRSKDLEAMLRALKQGLGCGGALEGEALVLQGDQRDRAVAWLTARGVTRVIRGS